jgi:hypothetical protein
MSTTIAFVAALALSIAGLCYVLLIDEKRRRVFRIQRSFALPRSKLAGWLMVLGPGIGLLTIGQVSAFLAWFGAVTTSAWLMAATRPGTKAGD